MDNPSLFEDNNVPRLPGAQKLPKWRLVTNQRNLLYMLAAGLIMPPKGFGGKYYRDALSSFPGWIPLFADNVPQAAIELAVSEKRHLTPCIATLDLGKLRGRIMAMNNTCRLIEITFPEELDGSETALFVPAPLPATWIESISFSTKENKANCEADSRDFGNVPLADFKCKTDASLFTKAPERPWPPAGINLPERDTFLDKPQAAGGVMAMLSQMGNRGDLGSHACRLGFDPRAIDTPPISDPVLRELGAWMTTGVIGESTDILPKLFWGAVESIMTCRSASGILNPIDMLLEYLEKAGNDLDEKMKSALSKLTIDLRKLTGLADTTITELFERHTKPFSRAMILFFLRDNCSDLIDFSHHLLTEADYLATAILFAARDGWIGLPLNLRNVDGLQEAVSHRMAALAHRMAGSEIDLGAPPARPMTLRDLFVPGDKGWTTKQREAALLLARESKWHECIQTRINLGRGDYKMLIDGSGVQLILAGDVKTVATEVNAPLFFNLLGKAPVSSKIDRKVRDILKV